MTYSVDLNNSVLVLHFFNAVVNRQKKANEFELIIFGDLNEHTDKMPLKKPVKFSRRFSSTKMSNILRLDALIKTLCRIVK